MEKEENRKKSIIKLLIGIFSFAAIIFIAAYAYLIPKDIGEGFNANSNIASSSYLFTATSGSSLSVETTEETLVQDPSAYGLIDNDSTSISVSLTSSSNDVYTECSYDIVMEYQEASDIYLDAGNYVPYDSTYPYELELKILKNNSSLTDKNLDEYGTPVNRKVTLGHYSTSSSSSTVATTENYSFELKVYNIPVEQNNIIGKEFTAQVKVENVSCDIVDQAKMLGNYLINNSSAFTGFDTTDSYGLKRFVGSNTATVNNYICLGDSSTSGSCNANNLYRIIGVVSNDTSGTNLTDGMVKVLKNTSVGEYKWDGGNSKTTGFIREGNYINYNGSNPPSGTGTSSGHMPLTWNESCLNKRNSNCVGTEYSLNDTTNSFISGINFSNKIENVSWHCGVMEYTSVYVNYSVDDICLNSQKIGLIDPNDKLLISSDGKTWLGTGKFWANYSGGYYYESANYYLWRGVTINSNTISLTAFSQYLGPGDFRIYTSAVRPVFYLKNTVEYASGTGTQSDPIRIK